MATNNANVALLVALAQLRILTRASTHLLELQKLSILAIKLLKFRDDTFQQWIKETRDGLSRTSIVVNRLYLQMKTESIALYLRQWKRETMYLESELLRLQEVTRKIIRLPKIKPLDWEPGEMEIFIARSY